jgi:hypothetical protein
MSLAAVVSGTLVRGTLGEQVWPHRVPAELGAASRSAVLPPVEATNIHAIGLSQWLVRASAHYRCQ